MTSFCFVSQSLNNPDWSSCNFFAKGLIEAAKECGDKAVSVGHSDIIPEDRDWYIDVDSGVDLLLSREYGKTAAMIIDLFGSKFPNSMCYKNAATAEIVIATNECSRKFLKERGVEARLITFGINEEIWKPMQSDKEYDSIFIGNISRETAKRRKGMIDSLNAAGFDIRHSHMDLFLEGNADACNKARIGLEIPNEGYDTFGIRPLELIGCGLPLLTIADDIITKILPEDLVTYYTVDNLVEKYREVAENLSIYKEKGLALREYMLTKFTYKHVGHRIIKILKGKYDETEMFCS